MGVCCFMYGEIMKHDTGSPVVMIKYMFKDFIRKHFAVVSNTDRSVQLRKVIPTPNVYLITTILR